MQGMSLLGLYEVALGIDEDIQLKTMRVSNVLKHTMFTRLMKPVFCLIGKLL